MAEDKKILILVANSTYYPSNLMTPLIIKTWGKDPRVKTLIYQGDSEESYHDENKIYLTSSNEFNSASKRTLEVLKYSLENIDFDYLLRVTTTTYINIENLILFLRNKEPKNLFCGVSDFYPPFDTGEKKIRFISGAGFILSKDLVKLTVDNANNFDFSFNLDDVSIGKLLINELGIETQEGYRQDFYNRLPINRDIDINNYHYRFKLTVSHHPRYLEAVVLVLLHFKFEKKFYESYIWKLIFDILDLILFIVFGIIRLLNPHYLLSIFRASINIINKLFVKIIKSNNVTHSISKFVKRILGF